MSLLDDDLTEKLDIPMIFAAIESLRETMNKNLEEIAMHEKTISALHKNVSTARFELENVKNLLDEIVNPNPKYDDRCDKSIDNEKLNILDGSWWCPPNYSTTAAITANGARFYTTCDTYNDTKTITGIYKVDRYLQ